MSKLYGHIVSCSANKVTRTGSEWMDCHIRSWTKGIRVEVYETYDTRMFRVIETGGSKEVAEPRLVYETSEPL